MLLGSYEIPHGTDQRGGGNEGSEGDKPREAETSETTQGLGFRGLGFRV